MDNSALPPTDQYIMPGLDPAQQRNIVKIFLEACPDMVLLLGRAGEVIFCTKPFWQWLGLESPGPVLGMPLEAAISHCGAPPWPGDFYRLLKAVIETGCPAGMATRLTRPDGTQHEFNADIGPSESLGGVANGAVVVLSDTSELTAAKKQAEAASQAKSGFLSRMSHEIRTPMNTIIGLTDILLRSDINAQLREYTLNIKRSANALLALINDVLDYTKIENEEMELSLSYFSLDEMLENLCSIFQLLMQNKGLQFDYNLSDALPQVLYGDSEKIRQIITSLLGGALKATSRGSVGLMADWDGEALTIRVCDTGDCLSRDEQHRMFDPFVQLDARRFTGAGSGLGLPISRSLCQLMGGQLTAESLPGAGSAFTARIPAKAGLPQDLESLPVATVFTTVDARALAVDDIEINLFITQSVLESFGVEVTLARSGREAVELASAGGFDIIFMDHMMPEMDGLEATRLIRKGEALVRQTPIVALTANAIVGAREMFLKNGLDDFIAKPIEYADMAACLLKWLPRSKICTD